MTDSNQLRQVVLNLFNLFEKGEWDATKALFTTDAKIISQFGQKASISTVEEFIQNGKHGLLSKLGNPVYLDRRITLLGTGGFLEQHTTQLTINGEVVKTPACLVGKFDESGLITLVEEYLDPSAIMAALMK